MEGVVSGSQPVIAGQGQAAFTIVGQQEIVTRTVVFIKSQKHSAVIL